MPDDLPDPVFLDALAGGNKGQQGVPRRAETSGVRRCPQPHEHAETPAVPSCAESACPYFESASGGSTPPGAIAEQNRRLRGGSIFFGSGFSWVLREAAPAKPASPAEPWSYLATWFLGAMVATVLQRRRAS
jgi:hypothetical protein